MLSFTEITKYLNEIKYGDWKAILIKSRITMHCSASKGECIAHIAQQQGNRNLTKLNHYLISSFFLLMQKVFTRMFEETTII